MTGVDVSSVDRGCLTMLWCYRVIFIGTVCGYGLLSVVDSAPTNITDFDNSILYTTNQYGNGSNSISTQSATQGIVSVVATGPYEQNSTVTVEPRTTGESFRETTLKHEELSTTPSWKTVTGSSFITTQSDDVKSIGDNVTQKIATSSTYKDSNAQQSTAISVTTAGATLGSTTGEMSTTVPTETSGKQVDILVEVTTDPPPQGTTIVKREVNITAQSTSPSLVTKEATTPSSTQSNRIDSMSVTTLTTKVAIFDSSSRNGTTIYPVNMTEMIEVVDVNNITSPALTTTDRTKPSAKLTTNNDRPGVNVTDMQISGDDVTSHSNVASAENSTLTNMPVGSGEMDTSTKPLVNYTTVPEMFTVDEISQISTREITTATKLSSTAAPPPTSSKILPSPRTTNPTTAPAKGNGQLDGLRNGQDSLTTILLVVCAGLLILLIALCVFTYVKFRKKSRSIRKRLTFKDDAIYDNPIYHGRWEVPKSGEATAASCPRSLPMLISALPDEVVRLSKNEDTGFREQFMMLNKLSPSLPRQAATTNMNTHNNRYRDMLPFDHNRVKLSLDGDKSDYINASYVPGVKSESEYIASQGPLLRTAPDHWRMVWEHNIRDIAMLTTCEEGDLIFKAKCYQYWPNKENDTVNYGGIYVTLVSTSRLCRDNYKLKILHIRKGKDTEPRKVNLFQYIKWPDRRNPEDPEAFLEYREHVKREVSNRGEPSPLLVHCSAGVGRTGTFIAIDTLLQHMEEREAIDIYGLVLRLRKYRLLLVQNADQYKFVHSCLLMMLDKQKKAEVDEGLRKAGSDGCYPYENMVMSQRALVGELGGMVYREDTETPKQQALQSFLRKTKTNVQRESDTDDLSPSRKSVEIPSPTKSDGSPRPRSEPEQTAKTKPYSGGNKGDSERALAKELGGMMLGGAEKNASPGKSAAIKAFLRNKATMDNGEVEADNVNRTSSEQTYKQIDSNDNRSQEESIKQTTSL